MNPLKETATGLNLATYALVVLSNSGEVDLFAYLWNQEVKEGNDAVSKFAEYTGYLEEDIERLHSKALGIIAKTA